MPRGFYATENAEVLSGPPVLTMGLRDLLLPRIAATVAPLGAILTPATEDLEFACPLPAEA